MIPLQSVEEGQSGAASCKSQNLLPKYAAIFYVVFVTVLLGFVTGSGSTDSTLLPRLLALYGVTFLVFLFLWVSGSWRELDWSAAANPLVLLLAAYVAVTILSLFVAANVYAGLTEVFRSVAFLLTVTACCVLLPRVGNWRLLLLKCAVLSGVLALVAGTFEWLLEVGGSGLRRSELEKVQGMMSNVNLYASYLVLVLPFCLAGFFLFRGFWRWSALLVATGILGSVVLLQSRSSYLGLLVGGSILGVLVFFRRKELRVPRRWLAWGALGAAAAAALSVAFAAPEGLLRTAAERATSIFALHSDPSIAGRLQIWRDTSRMAADHPWLGVGAGNFQVRLLEYFDMDGAVGETVGWVWLTPHNDLLGVLAEKGIFGLIFFAAVFLVAAVRLLRVVWTDRPKEDSLLALFTLMSLLSILTTALFDFPLTRVNHLVYVSLALGVACLLPTRPPCFGNDIRAKCTAPLSLWCVRMVCLASFAGVSFGFLALQQDRWVKRARHSLDNKKWEAALAYTERASSYLLPLDRLYTPLSYIKGYALSRMGRFEEAVERFEEARKQLPTHTYINYQLGAAYAGIGEFESAVSCFQQVQQRHPKNPEVATNLATALLSAGHYREAADFILSLPPKMQTPTLQHRLRQAELVLRNSEVSH